MKATARVETFIDSQIFTTPVPIGILRFLEIAEETQQVTGRKEFASTSDDTFSQYRLDRELQTDIWHKMNRFSETETALLVRLRALKATPFKSLNLLDISQAMRDDGFSLDEISSVLVALEQDKLLARAPGDRLMILKELPE